MHTFSRKYFFSVAILTYFTTCCVKGQETSQTFNDCGGSLALTGGATYGVLTSPGYPTAENPDGTYPSDSDCFWYLGASSSTLIQFKIWTLSIEPGEGGSNITCEFDYLNVSIESAGSKVFCGTHRPEEPLKGMGTFRVHFHSDDSVNYIGFQSTFKQVYNYNPCDPNPCNVGACEFIIATLLPECTCPEGSTGKYCEIDIDECLSEPCQNGASCQQEEEVNKYKCTCTPGWEGHNCEKEKEPPCTSGPCLHGGSCFEIDKETFGCNCLEAYEGETCDIVTGCGNPGIPYLEELRRFSFGTTLVYSCTEEFDISGPENATCLLSGEWSEEKPQCRLKGTKGEEDSSPGISPWSKAMALLGSFFAVQLVVFVTWMIYKSPWSTVERTTSFEIDSTKPEESLQEIESVRTGSICTVTDESVSNY